MSVRKLKSDLNGRMCVWQISNTMIEDTAMTSPDPVDIRAMTSRMRIM